MSAEGRKRCFWPNSWPISAAIESRDECRGARRESSTSLKIGGSQFSANSQIQWRRRRFLQQVFISITVESGDDVVTESIEASAACAKPTQSEVQVINLAFSDYKDLVGRAQEGDEKALQTLTKFFDGTRPDLWKQWGDFAALCQRIWIERISGDQLLFREALKREQQDLREDLAGPNASSLEYLLVDRILACWLQVYHVDAQYAQSLGEITFEEAEYLQRRTDRAHRRFLSAVKALAQVRRLLGTSVQLNVGVNQVNIASG